MHVHHTLLILSCSMRKYLWPPPHQKGAHYLSHTGHLNAEKTFEHVYQQARGCVNEFLRECDPGGHPWNQCAIIVCVCVCTRVSILEWFVTSVLCSRYTHTHTLTLRLKLDQNNQLERTTRTSSRWIRPHRSAELSGTISATYTLEPASWFINHTE